ncbi:MULTISPECIES: ribonuclease J [Alteribacter]|uniref:Ribonuclease J n=1 Tax=Alteribacter keqinensis TaxID=2483800 RepID=A0A3M7TXM8_9BACI|nr:MULTISPECIES: ribonuclease J [Alteribacter]MBM7094232.1 ribonuclease J [Alteribacter salitolerans]RNA69534.1 ribonuclease J [Alteribacter keqinensis]
MSKQTEKIRIAALGGIGEIGKNMYVVELDEEIIVIDGGLMFPEDDMLGVDLVIPDFSFLTENKDRVKGIVLSHGHEDHIGAIPYLVKELNVPVYGTRLTLAFVKQLCKDLKGCPEPDTKEIHAESKIRVGNTPLTFFHVTHSIPGALGICIHTSQGPIVYTGDFKLDPTPVDGRETEIGKLAALGEKGVLCLMSDSMNAEKPGVSLSETKVSQRLNDAFYEAPGRMIIAAFSTNIDRIQQALDAADRTGRKVVPVGSTMKQVIDVASKEDYLTFPPDLIIDPDDAGNYADDKLVILTTGSKSEPLSALSQMAQKTHKQIKIKDSDRVIISAAPSPGNEKSISRTIDLLHRSGADVVYGKDSVHASGHGYQEELKLMLNLIKPRHFIPVHGEFRMQYAHGMLAKSCKVEQENIFLLEKGECVEFEKRQGKKSGKIPAGNVLIDGLGVGDVGNIVLRDRRLLSKDGILVVVITLNKSNECIAGPNIISRGFVYVRESEDLIKEAESLVTKTIAHCSEQRIMEWSQIKSSIRDALGKFLFDKTKRRPMVMPIIMDSK